MTPGSSPSPLAVQQQQQKKDEEALFVQSQLFEMVKMEQQKQRKDQQQQQQQRLKRVELLEDNTSATASMEFSASEAPTSPCSPRKAGSVITTIATTIADDDWTMDGMSSSETDRSRMSVELQQREIYRQHQEQYQQQQLQKQNQTSTPTSSPSSCSLLADNLLDTKPPASPLRDDGNVNLGSPSSRESRRRPRHETSSSQQKKNVDSLYQQQQEYIYHKSLSQPLSEDTLGPSSTNRGYTHAVSMSALALPSSPVGFLSELEDLPSPILDEQPWQQTRAGAYARHQSHEEWQRKRASLHPALPNLAGQLPSQSHVCPRNPSEQQEWNDREAKRQIQLPGVQEALAQRAASRGPVSPILTARSLDVDPDLANIRVARMPSLRLLRKSSSQASAQDNNTSFNDLNSSVSTALESCENGDFIVEEHAYVGAFDIKYVDEQGNPIVTGPPASIEQHPSDDHSTITHSISTSNTRQSNFTDEPLASSSVGRNSSHAQEPPTPPLPAEIVSSTLTAPVARVRITVQRAIPENGSDKEHRSKQHKAAHQQSTLSYIMGGLCCVIVFGGIFLALCYSLPAFEFVGLYTEDESPPMKTPRPSPAPAVFVPSFEPSKATTFSPTPVVLELPAYTMEAINNHIFGNAQKEAYQWLLDDISFMDRSLPRLYQRYALATLYYATNDDNGWERGGWLDHSLDECDWEIVGSDQYLPASDGVPYRKCDPVTGLIESIDLSADGLKGFIPPEVSLITTLKFLDLQNNDFKKCEQCLPSELGLLTALEHLNLYATHAKGALPSEIGLWTNIKNLELGSCRFDMLPSEVGRLVQLEKLDISRNVFQGTLPPELSVPLSKRLFHLDVDRNYFTGTIPIEFDTALAGRKNSQGVISVSDGQFFTARFTGNMFTGVVPINMCPLQQRFKFDCDPGVLCGCEWCQCATN